LRSLLPLTLPSPPPGARDCVSLGVLDGLVCGWDWAVDDGRCSVLYSPSPCPLPLRGRGRGGTYGTWKWGVVRSMVRPSERKKRAICSWAARALAATSAFCTARNPFVVGHR